jgi:hypothetical protein
MGLGWGTFFGGIGKLLDKIPIQGRKERWKNELDNLTKEKEALLKGQCDAKKAMRVGDIDKRLVYLNQLLKNSAGD